MKPLAVRLVRRSAEVKMQDAEFARLLDLVVWREEPWFPIPGRVAWYSLTAPGELLGDAGMVLRGAKLKGVGTWNPRVPPGYSGVHGVPVSDHPQRPSPIEYKYTSQVRHVGITASGRFTTRYSQTTPTGGLRLSRALREYENALILAHAGVPSIVPLFVVAYDGLVFDEEAMGAVVSLSPEAGPWRLHPLQLGEDGLGVEARTYYASVRQALGFGGSVSAEDCRLAVIGEVAEQIGISLRGFGDAGLFRHSGGWDNYQFDRARRRVILTDLDSSLRLESCTETAASLERLRDLGSALYKFVNKLYHPSCLGVYELPDLIANDPLERMLHGYFPEASRMATRNVARSLWTCFAPHLGLMLRHRAEVLGSWPESARKALKMDEDLFLTLAICLTWPLQANAETSGPALTQSEVIDGAHEYLGDRAAYLDLLLVRGRDAGSSS